METEEGDEEKEEQTQGEFFPIKILMVEDNRVSQNLFKRMLKTLGHVATKIIIENYGDKKPYIMALTTKYSKAKKEKCLKEGMKDYFTKPLKKNVLIEFFDELIEKFEKY